MYRLDASRLFVIMGSANVFLRGTMYLVITVYYVLAVHMNPLQLVLVGTVLEVSYFLFQIPTGLFFSANRLLQPRLTWLTQNRRAMARVLAIFNVVDVVCIVGFALAGSFILALTALLLRACTFGPAGLLRSVWYNQNITDSSVRATVMSMTGQTNALGQWVGGPVVGIIGNAVTLGAAITATGVVRSPISLLYGLSSRRGEPVPAQQERDSASAQASL